MARIQLNDLPTLEDLHEQEAKGIFGGAISWQSNALFRAPGTSGMTQFRLPSFGGLDARSNAVGLGNSFAFTNSFAPRNSFTFTNSFAFTPSSRTGSTI